jgi:hypothetical protein
MYGENHGCGYSFYKTEEQNKQALNFKHRRKQEKMIEEAMNTPLSYAEEKIADFLDHNNVKYKLQYDTFECISPRTGYILPYDFELVDYKVIIEFHGKQHFDPKHELHEDITSYYRYKDRDAIKKKHAEASGYVYVEIIWEDFEDERWIRKMREGIRLYLDSLNNPLIQLLKQ